MKIRKVILCALIIIGGCSYLSYKGFAKDSYNDADKKSAKTLIQNINKITDKNLNDTISNSKDSSDNIHNKTLKQFQNNDISIESDTQGEYLSFIDNSKKRDIENRSQKSKNISTNALIETSNLKDKATKIVESFISSDTKANLDNKDELVFIGQYPQTDGTIVFKWMRAQNGYQYDSDFAMVIIDQLDGSVVSASKGFFSDKPSNKISISSTNAQRLAKAFAEKESTINATNILRCELKIVNPDYYWTTENMQFNTQSRFAYEVTFNKADFTQQGDASIWIDAQDGSNIGGRQTK